MTSVEAEVNKYKNCRDRDELLMMIKEYKSLALKHAANLVLAGQYSTVALRLQEICDKLPAPRLIKHPTSAHGAPAKTATITKEEHVRISDDWRKKTNN